MRLQTKFILSVSAVLAVLMGLALGTWQHARAHFQSNLIIWLSFGALAMLVVVYICAARFVCRPIQRMGRAMEQIAREEAYGHELNEALGRDELAMAAQAFNRVLKVVRNSVSSLRHANEDLEQRVRERTAELERRNAELGAHIETALDAIIITNKEGGILEFNPAAQRTFECTKEQASRERKFSDLVSLPEHTEGIVDSILGKRIETPARRFDGRDFPAEVTINAIPASSPPKLVAFVRDITHRKQAELDTQTARELAECASQQAQQASRAKSDFLANMSHEIRTPLNGVTGMIEMLLRGELSQKQQHYASVARSSAEALLAIINDILDFSKIEAGKMELAAVDFDLQQLLVDVMEMLSIRAAEKHIGLKRYLKQGVPRFAKGDPDRLRQIVINLLSNAVKFTDHGEVKLQVSIDDSTPNKDGSDLLRFEVIDSGIGIPEDRFDRLFNSFSQVDSSTTRKYGGTGLGLAICKQLAGLMGGEIGVRSELGVGSTFWFTARLQKPSGTCVEPRKKQEAATSTIAKRNPQSVRLLVAEDNPVNQFVAIELLQAAGFVSDVVGDGVLAVQAVQSGKYAMVLMDCQMPKMDGMAATVEIRRLESLGKAGAHIPIIALTAGAVKGERERCLACGMDDYLSKPLNPRKLIEIIETHLAGTCGEVGEEAPANSKPTADASEPINWDGLLDNCLKNVEFVGKMLDSFAHAADQSVREIQQSILAKDNEAAARAAHSLKGAAAYLAAPHLRQAAAELEELARSGEIIGRAEAAAQNVAEQVRLCLEQIPKLRAKAADLKGKKG